MLIFIMRDSWPEVRLDFSFNKCGVSFPVLFFRCYLFQKIRTLASMIYIDKGGLIPSKSTLIVRVD